MRNLNEKKIVVCQPPQQLISKYPGNQEQRRYSPRNKFGLVCSICETKFNSYDLINEHVATCHYVDYLRELKADIKPRNMALVEEWRDTNNHLKCNKCDFVAQWPVALEQHAISHVTAIYPYKCFVCSHTYKRWWDLVTHFDHVHATFGKNPYKMKDRIAARRVMSADVDPATNFLALLINTALQNQHKQNEQQHMMEQQKEEQYMMEQQKEEQQKEQFLARKSTNDDWFL